MQDSIFNKLPHTSKTGVSIPFVVENHPLDGFEQLFHNRTSELVKSSPSGKQEKKIGILIPFLFNRFIINREVLN